MANSVRTFVIESLKGFYERLPLKKVAVDGSVLTPDASGVVNVPAGGGMTYITYAELKNLRDTSSLVPGMQYRIIDYECTTMQADTSSAGHQFDIIVVADSSAALNENARAIQHTDSSADYFYNSDLSAWELKYTIDNDSDKFAWANCYDVITINGSNYIRSINNDTTSEDGNPMYAWKRDNTIWYTTKNEYDIQVTDYAYKPEYTISQSDIQIQDKAIFSIYCYVNDPGSGSGSGYSGSLMYSRDPDHDDDDYYAWYSEVGGVARIYTDSSMPEPYDEVYVYDNGYYGIVGYVNTVELSIYMNEWFRDTGEGFYVYSTYYKKMLAENSSVVLYINEEHCDIGDDLYSIPKAISNISKVEKAGSKGIIFYMKDEFGNECGYDFKNILMKFYCIIDTNTALSSLNNTYSASKVIATNTYTIISSCTITTALTEYRYTFDLYIEGTHYDYSLNTASKFCFDNVIAPMHYTSSNNEKYKKRWINFISFRNANVANKCYGNKFGAANYNISLMDSCYSCIFGDNCYSNTFGHNCYGNTFGHNCYSNIFGIGCADNRLDNNCYSNTFSGSNINNKFGVNCTHNTLSANATGNVFGQMCFSNNIGTNSNFNTFDNYCRSNGIGNNSINNTFGNYCSSNIIGTTCQYNTFDSHCSNNIFGNYCESNKFGNDCVGNTMKDYCNYNVFLNRCCYIRFGTSSNLRSHYRFIIIESGNSYINLDTNQTISSANRIQNIKIAQGVNSSSPSKTITHNTVNDIFQTVYQPANSQIISV